MEGLAPIYNTHTKAIRVTFVYLSEAHAEDEWPIGNAFRSDVDSPLWSPALDQSRTTATRLERVSALAKRFNLPDWIRLAADITSPTNSTPTGQFESVYGAWPTGFYVVAHQQSTSKLVHVAEPCSGMFATEPVLRAISIALAHNS